ncbi:MAG: DUF2867 domain-containing protein [Chloroflexi bacterium]|nr:DUF2867 domain-containing protein [Chloroflexota bacterium]
MRISEAEFKRKRLFVHQLLADVPLHDVWAVRLKGGGTGRTLADLQRQLGSSRALESANPAVMALFRLRALLGQIFRWDVKPQGIHPNSYLYRLPADMRAQSQITPGSKDAFNRIYAFENESLSEVINRTVHAFLHMSLQADGDDYVLFLAVYVKAVNALTPFYMALIDPFRHWIVYPAALRQIAQKWAAAYA